LGSDLSSTGWRPSSLVPKLSAFAVPQTSLQETSPLRLQFKRTDMQVSCKTNCDGRRRPPPMCASFSLVFRIFLLVRVIGAMYSGLSDCDEVFKFWEPLHYLDRGHALQTWKTSP
ncbi:hypothetical protein BC835DRAFT_1443558, partial [Cytidiella melzeri]